MTYLQLANMVRNHSRNRVGPFTDFGFKSLINNDIIVKSKVQEGILIVSLVFEILTGRWVIRPLTARIWQQGESDQTAVPWESCYISRRVCEYQIRITSIGPKYADTSTRHLTNAPASENIQFPL